MKENAGIDLGSLTTEARNPRTMDLDRMTPTQIARMMNEEDAACAQAVGQVTDQIGAAIDWAGQALDRGGRIVYFGAGTSGRLGVLDAVECPPTFGVDEGVVVGLIAGGSKAFLRAVEGAEDSMELGAQDLQGIGLNDKDLAVGIAASGRTPYVVGGLRYAHSLGCRTVAIACNKGSAVGKAADLAIEPVPGPEVLTGSTRLKAGTVQKMVLNMISTGAMVHAGKVYQNLMVDVQQTNEKLVSRARRIVMEATGCSEEEAARAIGETGGSVKAAVVMVLAGVGADDARATLNAYRGKVREAVKALTLG